MHKKVKVSLEDSQALVDDTHAAIAALRKLAQHDQRFTHDITADPLLLAAMDKLDIYRVGVEAQHGRIKILGR